MMIGMPFLVAVVPGFLVLLLTWWFKKLNLSLVVRLLPSILTACTSIVLFFYGYIEVRGFEGIAYGFLAFFLLCFSALSSVIATKSFRAKQA
ncbi:YesK-like protein [Bacillus sp. OV322]|uniref:YesK family protein n=1 Tax=Bacillus sp. OV322 TaxID=1882764 RepID=UPI0008F18BB9|nr:YesK family protein [Bacillus sp. OV322]SFC52993.1 YesK-like protein [Bacillus sp. OV322]